MRGPMNESKTIPKTHELHSIRSVGITNVVQTRKMTCCCLNCVIEVGQCEFFEIASKWVFQSVIGETLSKSTINKAHRKIINKGAVSDDQIRVNKNRMGKLGKPEKTREKKISEDEEIDLFCTDKRRWRKEKENCLLKMVPRCHRVAGKKSNLGMN